MCSTTLVSCLRSLICSFSSDSEIFTIWCRETPFRLTRSQIETDSPNYFTTAFLDGGFNEQTTRTIKLGKHPQLFALILEHLSGYTVLPLQPSVLPRYMSVEAAKENLWRDAQYFGLDSLCKELKPPVSQMGVPPVLSRGYEGIVDFSRLQNQDGGLILSLEGESDYHIEGIDGLPLFRVQDILVRSVHALSQATERILAERRCTDCVCKMWRMECTHKRRKLSTQLSTGRIKVDSYKPTKVKAVYLLTILQFTSIPIVH